MTRTRLGVESLETREVPAIFLLNGTLHVVGGDFNDTVTVSAQVGQGDDVVTELVATRTETRYFHGVPMTFQETKTVPIAAVNLVSVELGNGTNKYTGNHAKTAVVEGGTGRDEFIGGVGVDFLYGYGGNDTLSGRGGDDYLYGGDGHDYLNGGDGNDVIRGEGGNDMIYCGNGNDHAHGGEGSDDISGEAGNDVIRGEGGNDFLYGDAGNDLLQGGDGNDRLWGGIGGDYLDGGTGDDDVWQDYPPVSP
jgi:Ca2+-binding RTX toxin-like protein